MPRTERSNHDDAKPAFQVNIVELHVNLGLPFFLFGPVVEGSRAVERGLKTLFFESESDRPSTPAKRQAAA